MKAIYLLLAILGLALPYGAFVPWLMAHGPDFLRFMEDLIANPVSIFAWLDIVISAIVLLLFIVVESYRSRVRFAWLAFIGTLTVGVSFGLPLFLYLREKSLQTQ